MKIATFGSCLSRDVALGLVSHYGADHRTCVYHTTSEQFYKYFVAQSAPQPPLELIESLLVPGDAPDALVYARGMLRNQYAAHMGLWEFAPEDLASRKPFLRTMTEERLDLILLDNFADLSTRCSYLVDDPQYAESPIQFVHHFYKNTEEINRRFAYGEYIPPAQSAEFWRHNIGWMRERQPHAAIVFLCYFGCTSSANPERQRRAAAFGRELAWRNADGAFHLVPPLEVGPELQVEGDWMHLAKPVYRALAGHVFLLVKAGLGRLAAV